MDYLDSRGERQSGLRWNGWGSGSSEEEEPRVSEEEEHRVSAHPITLFTSANGFLHSAVNSEINDLLIITGGGETSQEPLPSLVPRGTEIILKVWKPRDYSKVSALLLWGLGFPC